jgi:hypothetical protein
MPAMVAKRDEGGGKREVPGQLVEKSREEGSEALMASRTVAGEVCRAQGRLVDPSKNS